MNILKLIFCFVFIISINFVKCDFPGSLDRVNSSLLPGVNFPTDYRHYSGYLDGGNGAILHYWLFESQSSNPGSDPLAMWLNGGPGASSLIGAFTEIGPITVKNGSIHPNPYSWTKNCNILFLESPSGVGFSYHMGQNYSASDQETARQNFQALKSFFVKFPHFSQNQFYLIGESYAGIYIPTLASLLLDEKFPVNFQGVAIGNGYLDFAANGNSILYYLHYHGLLLDSTQWSQILHECCLQPTSWFKDHHRCDFMSNQKENPNCFNEIIGLVADFLTGKRNLNPYNILSESGCPNPYSGPTNISANLVSFVNDPEEVDSSSDIAILSKGGNPPCLNYDPLTEWLNKEEVQHALHINHSIPEVQPWAPWRLLDYSKQVNSVEDHLKKLVNSGKRVLIYNGDLDADCNFLGTSWFLEQLGFNISLNHRPWLHNGQIAGFKTEYSKNLLTFATIRGSGHMVPEDKPAEALALFQNFISKIDLQ